MVRILSSLVAFFSITTLFAQTPSGEIPKLVVGITIDQFRGDYLEMFRHKFGSKGFNRLLNNGLVYSNVYYDFPNLNKASSITTIFTGANPSYHGIMAENRYLVDSNREISSFFDDNYLGNFTTEKLSPLPVKVSTIADELKIASGGQSDIFAFAPDASQALASGGHAASGAFWIEEENGKWATTTFYKNRQPVIDQHNRSGQSLTYTINSLTWRPAIDVNQYDAFPYTRNRYNFQHYLGPDKKDHFRLFKQSPYVNKEVNDMAVRLLESGSLGKRMNPDFLALTFYAGNYEKALDKNYSVEIQDTYYRLDQELGRLLDAIDASVGLKNTLIFVVSTGYFDEQETLPDGMVTSGGDFYPERSQALLNMYLMALYGREQWIKKYYDRQFFFDRKLLEDKKIDLREFQQRAAEFLVQSAGIQDVITSYQMLHGAYNQDVQYYRNGFYKGQSGDLFLRLQPGWRIVDPQSDQNVRVRNNAVVAPVIFFGSDIKPQRIERTIEATEIAPSVAYRLRIRAPNAAEGEILQELFR
ncbi:Type I phosphodiesterase / nucleotide pyrophosphatase [Proteiniphilum saccharofermentans]|uniref:Type I phosphodiesterase / nucleotide pyrophosphatase n=1 Tax=Proteiniphilum saccharofermentans TaxID=1642647 RepID=A0A1R3SWK6_9BACT|nr:MULTISPECIES: alkaline phosphatase family protein [Proteiniphilum]MDY9918901.1 alkaline phosphatase family protein [Proteiniphilum sp.]SCD20666.1 Type I phosphodiesterase / nucleotide pyrophosphatase [Proteiniphilum saccharofermentans]SFS50225.1 Type I phosphodiesterase / nucleotide pyrophosphatase [Porphyromonadaceae bacterium NLAE-zl-C104]